MEKNQANGLISSIDDAFIAYNENFVILLINHPMELLCNIKKEEIQNKTITPE